MRNLSHAAAALIAVLAACTSTPQDDRLTDAYSADDCPSCAEWNEPQSPFRIFGNTYYVGTRGLAAILITSPDGHVLIDGGLPNTAPLIQANIGELGFDMADVLLILNSHAHFDHAGGIAALQRASGARVVASGPSAEAIRKGNAVAGDPQHGQLLDFPRVTDVEEFADGGVISSGTLSLTAHITPVHSLGGTTWTWQACEEHICLNLVYADSQTPLAAEGFRYSDSPFLEEFERGIGVIERLSCDILITPHPGASNFWQRHESEEGLVDATACARYARTARERLAGRLEEETR
jgi:metallo-beta-lactamase class B